MCQTYYFAPSPLILEVLKKAIWSGIVLDVLIKAPKKENI
jgi:hypothetical protein